MKLLGLAFRNLRRNKVRVILTILGVAIALLTCLLLQTAQYSWTASVDYAANDRTMTRHKISLIMPLPKRYVDEVRAVSGVKAVTWFNWFGAKDPKHENEFFGTMAVDPQTLFEVMDELIIPDQQKQDWQADRRGLIVGDVLANKMKWKIGDRVVLRGSIYPGDWDFTIRAIYTATRRNVDRSTVFLHWGFVNDISPPPMRDLVGWIATKTVDPLRTAEIAMAIDKHFEEKDIQTISQSERAMSMSFLGMFGAVLKAFDIISFAVLGIMVLILGNTIAMGVRERTNEYGVLRALGFAPIDLSSMILVEASLIGALGGSLGLLISYPFINQGMGRWIEENMGTIFPFFRVPSHIAVAAFILSIVLGIVATIPSLLRVHRLKVVDALRHTT